MEHGARARVNDDWPARHVIHRGTTPSCRSQECVFTSAQHPSMKYATCVIAGGHGLFATTACAPIELASSFGYRSGPVSDGSDRAQRASADGADPQTERIPPLQMAAPASTADADSRTRSTVQGDMTSDLAGPVTPLEPSYRRMIRARRTSSTAVTRTHRRLTPGTDTACPPRPTSRYPAP